MVKRVLLPLVCLLTCAAGAGGASSKGVDLCVPVGKLPPGLKLPGTNNPPGYVRLPPGLRYPGAVQCPTSGGSTKPTPPKTPPKPKTSKPKTSKPKPVPTTIGSAKPTGCPKSTVAVTILGKRTCTGSRGVPAHDNFLMLGSVLTRNAIEGKYEGAVDQAIARSAKPGQPAQQIGYGAAQRDVTAIGGTFDQLVSRAKTWPYDAGVGARVASSVHAADPAARATQSAADGATVTYGPATSSESASGITAGGTATVTDSSGVKGTVTMTGHIPKGKDGQLIPAEATIGFDVNASKGGAKEAFMLSFGAKSTDGLKFDAPCPTAAGDVNANETWDVKYNILTEHTGVFQYWRKRMALKAASQWHGVVGPDAALTKISFSHSIVATGGRSWAVGPFQGATDWVEKITASGTIDGKSGAVTLDSFTISGNGSGTGIAAGFASDFQASLPQEERDFRKLISDQAAQNWERFKSAEKEWQQENRCAKLTFDPASGAPVNAGSTVGVAGTVESKQNSTPSDSRWESPTFTVGSLAGGLPGSTTAPKPIKFKVKGAGAPSGDVTVDMKARATSRAGIASDEWVGKVSGWTVTISGPVATQQTNCFLLTSSISAKVVVRKQTVGGVTGFHGTAPLAYGSASVSPCGGISYQCTYNFNGVTGATDVVIEPSADGKTLAVKINIHDRVDGAINCPGLTGPVGGGLADGYVEQFGSVATLTFPAEGLPADRPLNWNVPGPIRATGSLTIHVEPG